MSNRLEIEYRYHHLGIPTDIIRPHERYSDNFKMYTSDNNGDFRVQFHRFEKDSPLHPIIKNNPHIALQVDNLEEAIKGREILLGPYEPIEGYKVAIINDGGLPVELIETDLSIEELWGKAKLQEDLNTDGLKHSEQ
ncbi:hypothetical protein A9P82_13450 [Arachidicoccus ginsenosidimutans]|uniref:VOC family protein n=1 Tax=Arachidicoccus sp. BS20 TaxID=1850526 RepID=UPI0007F07364|nr:glyoxalase/bleomycin resistance/dioxygenase family protein [Arachidicoccus sp. BS20]ANI90204.1 hypothetical protein A9P82_13450 [Arachidicoccus sp. BS20]